MTRSPVSLSMASFTVCCGVRPGLSAMVLTQSQSKRSEPKQAKGCIASSRTLETQEMFRFAVAGSILDFQGGKLGCKIRS